jgi:uncharacterized protein (TIGR02271 family)
MSSTSDRNGPARDAAAIPIVQEQLDVTTERVLTGRVEVRIEQHEVVKRLDLEAVEQNVEVERIAINQEVEAVRPPWHEGDTLVVPVYEEQVVVQRRLVLKEEVRLRTLTAVRRWQEAVPIREEKAVVRRERLSAAEEHGAGANDDVPPTADQGVFQCDKP